MASFSFKTAKALGLDVTLLARPDVSPRDLVFAMEVASVSFPQMIVRRAVFAATAMLLGSDWAFAEVPPPPVWQAGHTAGTVPAEPRKKLEKTVVVSYKARGSRMMTPRSNAGE
jgi:hypothetical protein